MSGFVEGVPRDQVTLFPDCLAPAHRERQVLADGDIPENR